MPDIKKIIKGLEELEGFLFKEYTNIKAEESKIYYDRFKSLSDALALLKEQEEVEPKKGWFLNNLNIPEEHWFCGKCDEELVGKGKYCANCGQAVKWDDK